MSDTATADRGPRLGIAGAGLRGMDKEKAAEGVVVRIPTGMLKGLEMRVRAPGRTNPRHQQFMDDWAAGKFREAIRERRNGADGDSVVEVDEDVLNLESVRATTTPEYLAYVLVADLPQGVAIPERVDDVALLPEAIHDHYMPVEDGEGWRRKKNRRDWVEYTPEIGVWLFSEGRYPDLTNWAWRLASREEQFLEDQVEAEGNV